MMGRQFLAATAVAVLAAGCAAPTGKQDKVVYHINEGLAQASNGLRNIGNHLEVNPDAKIVVVTHALGVDQFIEYVTWVPSGVAEVSRLQLREGYAYLKP